LNRHPIYLDYNATTPVDRRVLDEMLPYFSGKFGNASSKTHSFGWKAADAVEHARERLAALVNCEKDEIIFTSGATESINLALKGVFETYREKGNHIITAATEHKVVLDCCHSLEKKGASVTYLKVDAEGFIDLNELEKAISEKTILICVMLANNETGVLQPLKQISEMAHRHNIIFMSDATQAIGKIKVDVQDEGIDLLPVSAHKFYGPKGVGALFIRRKKPRVILSPLIEGGGHEKGLRSGTLNVPGIVGLGKAAEIASDETMNNYQPIKSLRVHLENELLKIPGTQINGSPENRLPNTLNMSFSGISSSDLIKAFADKIAVATGSACTSALPEPSHVLKAMGVPDERAYASIRFSLGKYTTPEEIDETIRIVRSVVSSR
jgi:cysteine desulfurase